MDNWRLTLITAPALEPVTVQEARDHLRITEGSEDGVLQALIAGARAEVEDQTGRALITQTWEVAYDAFPLSTPQNPFSAIQLPLPPLQSVTSVKYTDTDGVVQTLDVSKYTVDTRSEPARITPAYEEVWPDARWVPNAVVVKFVAGYGASGDVVPERLRQAILLRVADLYEHREDTLVGVTSRSIGAVQKLLTPFRTWGP